MYDTILFPTDGSEGAETARTHALELAEDQDAVLHILHVVGLVSPAASLHEMLAERMIERGNELVETGANEGKSRGIPVETAVVEGDPADVIVDYAATEGIDVIVMPAHGRTGLTKTILGSVTDKVIRKSNVPVTVIKLDR